MDKEVVKIFDEQGSQIGTATRQEVHEKGLWHETFQVYFIDGNQQDRMIYLQKRSHMKNNFPNLFDITVAGHLQDKEAVQDGVREIEEELGITVEYDDLTYLGVIRNTIAADKIMDKEFSHVYLYECTESMESFILQPEEVEGMVKVSLNDFLQFYSGNCSQLAAEGFTIEKDGKKAWCTHVLTKENFVPHAEDYFLAVARAIDNHLSTER